MSRPYQTKSAYIQTFVRSCSDLRLLISRFSCVLLQTFVRFSIFPDYVIVNAWPHLQFLRSSVGLVFHAFTSRFSCVHVQTLCIHVPIFDCLCSDFCEFMFRLSCVHVQTFIHSACFLAFMSRFSCVHSIFVGYCPDFCSFNRVLYNHVKTILRSSDFRLNFLF